MVVMFQFSGLSRSFNIKNLVFRNNNLPKNRASSPRQIDPYAVFGAMLYIYTVCKWTRIAQSA